MNRPGHQLLTGPAFSLNENRCIGGRDIFNQAIDVLHLGVFADDPAEFGSMFNPGSQFANFFFVDHGAPDRPCSLI